jgi:hypothetical protein
MSQNVGASNSHKPKGLHVLYKDNFIFLYYYYYYYYYYGSTALVDLGRFFSFLIYTQSIALLGRVIGPSQGRYLHAEQQKHRINTYRHPCLEWD